jgi:hypothetical protein
MTTNPIDLFDACMNILGAIGLYPAIRRLLRAPRLNPLEIRLKWILIFMFLMMLVRIPVVGFDISGLFVPLTYLIALLLQFAVYLYFETLQRRHMPKASKIFLSLGTIYLAIATFLGALPQHKETVWAFAGFIALNFISVIIICIFRNRKHYTHAENLLIDLSVLALVILAPMTVSDMNLNLPFAVPKMGVIGSLIFAYVSLYNQALFQEKRLFLLRLGKSILFSIFLAGSTCLLVSRQEPQIVFRLFMIFLGTNLVYRIWFAIKHLDGEDDFYGFVRAVSDSDKTNLRGFLLSLNDFFGLVDKKVVHSAELRLEYNFLGILKVFESHQTHLLSLFDIKEIQSHPDDAIHPQDLEIYDQLADLLEKNEMTYICMLGTTEPIFVLFEVPMVGYRQMIELKTKLVSDFAKLIEVSKIR